MTISRQKNDQAQDLINDDLEILLVEAGICNDISEAGGYILAFSRASNTPTDLKNNVFYTQVKQKINNLNGKPGILHYLINTEIETTAGRDMGTSNHWLDVQLSINANGEVNTIEVYDSNKKRDNNTTDLYKKKILEGLQNLVPNNNNEELFKFYSTNIPQSNPKSCGYCALASLVGAFNLAKKNTFFQSLETNDTNGAKTSDELNESDEKEEKKLENNIISLCNEKLSKVKLVAAPAAPPAIEKYSKEKIDRLITALNATINQYAELKLSSRSNEQELDKLKEKINTCKNKLQNAKEATEKLLKQVDNLPDRNVILTLLNDVGVLPSKNNKEIKEILEKRIKDASAAIATAEQFTTRKDLVDKWLHGSIIKNETAITHEDKEPISHDQAKELVAAFTGSSTTGQSQPAIHSGQDIQSHAIDAKITVLTMSVEKDSQREPSKTLKAATIRTVDTTAHTIKSEFHYPENQFKDFSATKRGQETGVMELVAQQIKDHRAPMTALQTNQPMTLHAGIPPLPDEFIKGYIIYCAFKDYPLTVPPEYRQYQRDINKGGWFGRESILTSFEKAWVQSHPEDLGARQQTRLDETAYKPFR